MLDSQITDELEMGLKCNVLVNGHAFSEDSAKDAGSSIMKRMTGICGKASIIKVCNGLNLSYFGPSCIGYYW